MNEQFAGKNGLPAEQPVLASSGALSLGGTPLLRQTTEPFVADRKDGIFALAVFVLGYFFARWVLFSWQGWGVALFTLAYCGSVTLYFLKKGVHISRAGWFWLTVVVLTGISFALWTNNGLEPWRSLLLFCSAVYWVLCATGLPLLGKTSNWLGLDGFNGLFVIPLTNFACQYKSLAFLGSNKKAEGRQIFSIGLGLLLTLIVGGMVLPLLMAADSGGFSKITGGILTYLQGMRKEIFQLFFYGILAIPIAAYIFGLVSGSVHKRGCDILKKDSSLKFLSTLRVLPTATIYTLLGLLCTLYVVFIASQTPYFFSAFAGERPEGWQVYSEYARRGFFELCRIAAINLSVLTAANFLSKKLRGDSLPLKIFNTLLSLLTLILIATALSKMVLYIGVYGLSMRRLLPCLFMILMAVVYGGVIALQKWQYSIVRLTVGVGVVMLCTLCLLDPDSLVARYNAERYLSGTLNSFDVAILYRSGPAGVDPALKVYAQTGDPVLQDQLKTYLLDMQQQTAQSLGKSGDNLQKARARQKTMEFAAMNPAKQSTLTGSGGEGMFVKP
ncbi:DUF4153 domain-containing protein [Candidatus Formimonas warabiya]|uniref:Uncharacterized protein n=1 Tax=Formimonas warabiya TaxID=1761012 RepID=A0A3G1KSD8_FORW1|nr:DUF4173 domain-containing protein [Candidatus Formimonas warabiya]ATW25433.1 hypothetical protein DCMF_12190 [Candidatus Formimonas warabiya]